MRTLVTPRARLAHHGACRRGAAPCAALLALPLVLVGACRAAPLPVADADREVSRLLAHRRGRIPGLPGPLDPSRAEKRASALRRSSPQHLTLATALTVAATTSRDLRQVREDIWRAALLVSDERVPFRGVPHLGISGTVAGSDGDVSVEGGGSVTLERTLSRGGLLVLGAALEILKDISGVPLDVAASALSADLILPLARGAGPLVTLEPLRQSERELLYVLRRYARLQRTTSVEVATRYYRALEQLTVWRNEAANAEALRALVASQSEKAKVGRLPPFQADQARQDLLQGEDRLERAKVGYDESLDSLKLLLGLPVEVPLTLAEEEILAPETSLPPLTFGSLEEAGQLALRHRLDLGTALDRRADARRHVLVALDALRAGINLRLGTGIDSPERRPVDLEDAIKRWEIGLDLDLPLERIRERNALRAACLDVGAAARAVEGLRDGVLAEVRSAWRSLVLARGSRRIQEEGLTLARRRVESTELLLEQGNAEVEVRDRLEAQAALLQAQNALARVRVDEALSILALLRDVGLLRLDPRGQWQRLEEHGVGGTQPAPGASEGKPPATPTPP